MFNKSITSLDHVVIGAEKMLSDCLDTIYGDKKVNMAEIEAVKSYSITLSAEFLLGHSMYGDIVSHRVAQGLIYLAFWAYYKVSGVQKKSKI